MCVCVCVCVGVCVGVCGCVCGRYSLCVLFFVSFFNRGVRAASAMTLPAYWAVEEGGGGGGGGGGGDRGGGMGEVLSLGELVARVGKPP